jgi:hypothetical protein
MENVTGVFARRQLRCLAEAPPLTDVIAPIVAITTPTCEYIGFCIRGLGNGSKHLN